MGEKERQKRMYITLMVGAMFVYLNFAKNPFNKLLIIFKLMSIAK